MGMAEVEEVMGQRVGMEEAAGRGVVYEVLVMAFEEMIRWRPLLSRLVRRLGVAYRRFT